MRRIFLAGSATLALCAASTAVAQTPDEAARALALEAERQDRAEAAAEAARAAPPPAAVPPAIPAPAAPMSPPAPVVLAPPPIAPPPTPAVAEASPAFGLWGGVADSAWVGKDGRMLYSYKWNARRDAVTGEIYEGSLVARRTVIYRDPVGDGLKIDITYPDGRKSAATIQIPDDVTAIQANPDTPGTRTVYHRASATNMLVEDQKLVNGAWTTTGIDTRSRITADQRDRIMADDRGRRAAGTIAAAPPSEEKKGGLLGKVKNGFGLFGGTRGEEAPPSPPGAGPTAS